MISKTIISILMLVGVIFICTLAFNHISPWLGIGVALVAIYLAGKKLDNQINKNNK